MDFLKKTIDVFLHLDRYLNTWAGDLGEAPHACSSPSSSARPAWW